MAYLAPGSQSYNYTHMYDQVDLRGCNPKTTGCPGGIMNTLLLQSDFSEFAAIVKKARLDNILNSAQADFTLFVPTNAAVQRIAPKLADKLDIGEAQHLVKSLMLNRRITYDLLKDSPVSTFITRNPPNNLFIMNINGKTILSNCAECCPGENATLIHADIMCTNGIIHVIDNFPLANQSIQLR